MVTKYTLCLAIDTSSSKKKNIPYLPLSRYLFSVVTHLRCLPRSSQGNVTIVGNVSVAI